MSLRNGSYHGETKGDAARCDGAQRLVDQLEEPRHPLASDSGTTVDNSYAQIRIPGAQTNCDRVPLATVLTRVQDQIYQGLGESPGIRVDVSAIANDFEPSPSLAKGRLDGQPNLVDDLEKIHALRVNLKPTVPDGGRTREVLRSALEEEAPPLDELHD